MAEQFCDLSHLVVLKDVNINGKILKNWHANKCGQSVLEKNIYFIMYFYYYLFECRFEKISNVGLFSQPSLLIYFKGAKSDYNCM